MVEFRTCPDYLGYECDSHGTVRMINGKPAIIHVLPSTSNPQRKYYSITSHWSGHVHKQVFKAWGPPNPDPIRWTCIDHIDNNPMNNDLSNLRWSNRALNALNTERSKGWTLDETRVKPYRAHLKWMGQTTTLGRFNSAQEAQDVYKDCKEFIQKAYRENKYKDEFLVWAWRTQKRMKLFEVGADNLELMNALRQEGRSFSMLVKFMRRLGMID